VRRLEEDQAQLEHEPDDHDVAERAEAGTLAQRDPQHHHQRAGEADPDPGADARLARQALVEHIPWVVAELG
jgi:hypothetical protein